VLFFRAATSGNTRFALFTGATLPTQLVRLLQNALDAAPLHVNVALTVTVNVQMLVLPAASNAMHATVVVPGEKLEPDAGTLKFVTPGQLSLTAGA
jgi:hypothetical protein